MVTDPFLQSDDETMKNRLGIEHDPEALKIAERNLSAESALTVHQDVSGNFDAEHLRALHKHLFEDVYEWAGTTRGDRITLEGEAINVAQALPELGKGSTDFLASAYVERGLQAVEQLANSDAARSPDRDTFADAAGETLATLNQVHPFREGNGRTQRAFVEQLATRAGHTLDFEGVTGERMVEASVESGNGDNEALKRIISESLDPDHVALRLEAIEGLEAQGVEADAFWIEAARDGEQVAGHFVSRSETFASVVTHDNHFVILPPDVLDESLRPGDKVDFTYARERALSAVEQVRDDLKTVRDGIDAMPPAERPAIESAYFDALREVQEASRGQADEELTEPAIGTIYDSDARGELQGLGRDELAARLDGTGINPDELAARFAVQTDNAALEAHWVEADAAAIADAKGYDMGTEAGRDQAFRDVVDTYERLQEQGRDLQPDRESLIEEVKALARRDLLDDEQQRRLGDLVDQTLGRHAAQALNVGDTGVLRDFGSRDEQISIAEKYLAAAQAQGADRADALDAVAADRALNDMDKQEDRAQELSRQDQAFRQSSRDDGLER